MKAARFPCKELRQSFDSILTSIRIGIKLISAINIGFLFQKPTFILAILSSNRSLVIFSRNLSTIIGKERGVGLSG